MPHKRKSIQNQRTREDRKENTKRHKKNGKQKTATGEMNNDNFTSKLALKQNDGFRTLPITLLSGFLGSGKTTLLQYILNSSDHGLRIAVIVNDMAGVNVDANLIRSSTISANPSSQQKLVAMQNGCICCTLRGDFVLELARLAKAGEYEYVLIESTGISEPQQVAESFTKEFSLAMVETEHEESGASWSQEEKDVLEELATNGGLNSIAKIDTTVTVVDAFRFFEEFETIELLHQRFASEVATPEDERTVTDLMIDQIEFADVIIVNKIDMVDNKVLIRIRNLITTLNPGCKVLETSLRSSKQSENPYGVVPLNVKEIIATGMYSEETSIKSSGWLKSVHEMSVVDNHGRKVLAPKPETEEYGINSFVYRARLPFHPARLYELVYDKFVILEPQNGEKDSVDGEGEDEDDESLSSGDEADSFTGFKDKENSAETNGKTSVSSTSTSDAEEIASSPSSSVSDLETSLTQFPDIPLSQRLTNKKAHPLFQRLLRSKGFVWLATRPQQSGDWSQAGAMLTFSPGMQWFCTLSEAEWPLPNGPAGDDVKKLIKADYQGEWGDRRQELVLIGEGLDVDGLTRLLDNCLLKGDEIVEWENIMRLDVDDDKLDELLADLFEDGWEEWEDPLSMEEGDENGHVHGLACSL